MPRIAIQIITYKSSGHLPLLLETLKQQTFRDWKLYVCENSLDRVEAGKIQEQLEASGLPFHYFISDHNGGFDGGHQTLYRLHDAPLVMLLNDDVKLEPDYLEAVVARMDRDPKIASVTGLVYRWREDDERVIDTAGLEYRCLGQIVDRFAGVDTTHNTQAEEVFGVSGAIGLYRRSAVEAAGGLFDPEWFMYKEDADLAIRLRHAGFVAWFEPRAIAWHKRGLKEEEPGIIARIKNERQRSPLLRRYSYANQWRIYRRHWGSVGWRDRLATIRIEILRSALVFIASPSVFFKAWRMICSQK